MGEYFPPTHKQAQFNCIHCDVYSHQRWNSFRHNANGYYEAKADLMFCICDHCKKWSYWHNDRMIVPSEAPVPPAHQDMPEECIDDYNEARDIVTRSPKAASALLRLAVQKLMVALGEKGKKLYEDIGNLVKAGLPVRVQQALDYCRVVGNNAVHPGKIDLNDTPDIAHNLFDMINYIVEDRISRPKHIQNIFDKLPEDARTAIEDRDGGNA